MTGFATSSSPAPHPPYFQLLDRAVRGELAVSRYASSPATGGPWAPGLQHGGPPNALAVACAEQLVAEVTGRHDLLALRLAAEFVGPVPVDDVRAEARIVRQARSAVLVTVTLAAAGRECLSTRIWLVRDADTRALIEPSPPATVPDAGREFDADFPYGHSLEWRPVHGAMREPGPGAVWARPRPALLDGYRWSGLSRAAFIADSASGVGSALDWDEWSFLNVDLDLHLARPVHGDWILMEAETQLGGHGSALARSRLSDVLGPLGSGLQTLVVAPRVR